MPQTVSPIRSPRYRGRFAITSPESGIPYLAEAALVMNGPHDRHAHAEIQVLWVVEGEMGMEIGRQQLRIDAGHGVVLLPGRRHRVVLPSAEMRLAQARIIDLRLTDDANLPLTAFVRTLPAHEVVGGNVQRVMEAGERLRVAVATSGVSRTAKILSAVWELLAELAVEPADAGGDVNHADTSSHNGQFDRRISLAERYMADHLSDPIGVDAIAAAVDLSRSQLTRLFIDQHGIGPAQVLRRMRIDRAKHLLESSTLAIKEIARVCGFMSHHHFSRVFTEVTGRRPSAQRRG